MATQLPAAIKRAFLRSLWNAVRNETAQDDLNSDTEISFLEDALNAFLAMGFNDLKSGKISLGSSGFQHEVRWAPPAIWRSFGQEALFALQAELLDIFDDARAGGASSDLQIFNAMLADDRMQTVTSTQKDFLVSRYPWGRLG